mgnify:CR=1 FL=1
MCSSDLQFADMRSNGRGFLRMIDLLHTLNEGISKRIAVAWFVCARDEDNNIHA